MAHAVHDDRRVLAEGVAVHPMRKTLVVGLAVGALGVLGGAAMLAEAGGDRWWGSFVFAVGAMIAFAYGQRLARPRPTLVVAESGLGAGDWFVAWDDVEEVRLVTAGVRLRIPAMWLGVELRPGAAPARDERSVGARLSHWLDHAFRGAPPLTVHLTLLPIDEAEVAGLVHEFSGGRFDPARAG